MAKYLDYAGLECLTEIIKAELSSKSSKDQVDELEAKVGDISVILEMVTGVSS